MEWSRTLELVPDILWLQDTAGIYLDCNHAFERLVELSADEILGRRDTQILDPGLAESLGRHGDQPVSPGETRSHRAWLRYEGEPRLFEIIHIPLRINGDLTAVQAFARDITRHYIRERAYQVGYERLLTLSEHIPAAIAMLDRDLRYIFASRRWIVDYCPTTPDVIGRSHDEVFPGIPERWREIQRRCLDGASERGVDDLLRRADGRPMWISWEVHPWYDSDGEIGGIVMASEDISERKQAEEALHRSQQLFSLFMRHSPVYVFIKSVTATASRVVQASENFVQMIGIPGSEMAGKTTDELFPADFAAKIIADDWAVVSSGERLILDEEFGGRCYTTIKFPILQGDETLLAGYSIDITERKRLEAALQQQATTDELTGLVNRRHFIQLAGEEMRRAHRLGHPIGIALIDLDNLKKINDTLGHAAGDQALIALARVGRETLRAIDVLARFGGDEFALLLPESTGGQAYEAVERLRRAMRSTPIAVGNGTITLSLSAGVVGAMSGGESLDMLLNRADGALYDAKAQGRNRVVLG